MGLTIGMRLDPKYWRGFEYAFVVVYLAGILARLVGLTEPAISVFVIATCMSIMFVVQIGVLDARERHRIRSAKLDSE